MDYPKSDATVGLVGGKFSDGNPGAGVPASRDPASWANLVTDELINVLIAAGIEPDEAADNQLLQALQALGLRASTTALAGVSKLATASEAQGLSEATKALTAATLNSAFQGSNQSLVAAGGYQIFPGGVILQWGGASFSSTGAANLFPIAFPNAAFVPLTGNSGTSGLSIMLSYTALSNTGFTAKSSSGSGTYYYLALGH
ncbi:gp53-like domain-containing protein [Frateuria sp. YIM B11624]|uniref:gp53-like domain-containing protein n=1 Tax=Frateuria sp. YIM B11624 TaxID=3143185 RepID=UPI003C71F73F